MIKGILNKLVGDAGNIIDYVVTTKEEKMKLKNEMKKMILDSENDLQKNVTDRWKADMASDYWLSKNRQSAGSEALNHDLFLNMPTFNKIETKLAGPIENKIERPPLQKATLVDDSIGDAVSPVGDNIVG